MKEILIIILAPIIYAIYWNTQKKADKHIETTSDLNFILKNKAANKFWYVIGKIFLVIIWLFVIGFFALFVLSRTLPKGASW